MLRFKLTAVSILLTLLSFGSAAQPAYPDRPVTLIAPFGGALDIVARQVAQALGTKLNGNVIVEPKIGASGTIGMGHVARAAPDGYTLGLGAPTTLTSAPHLIKNLSYDSSRAFTYLGIMQLSSMVLVVPPQLKVNSMSELVALAKAQPGKLNFGSAGTGGSLHLAGEQFKAVAGVNVVHVPYKSGADVNLAMLGGDVHFVFNPIPNSLGMIQSGRLKALAVTGTTRDPALPDVPTMREVGFPDLTNTQFYGVVGPANMPEGIANQITRALREVANDPTYQDASRKSGGNPAWLGPDEFKALVTSDSQRWGQLIRTLGITAE